MYRDAPLTVSVSVSVSLSLSSNLDDGEDGRRQLHAGRHVCVERSAAGGWGEGGGEDEEQSHRGE